MGGGGEGCGGDGKGEKEERGERDGGERRELIDDHLKVCDRSH